ncbi:hypothetical protein A2982_03950 [candidate division WWE3 bacterium RIFCSPLOWO2_01_FULL_39_13]|uniref:Fido domain-containing protein n=1 Tax=candidate division WWE3 bacterium RIFCSPLOWO2_01_FULL_39_13 TaxID=1802624 RepID=A0A1F4V3T5_UNCKA|nr:MAG: hypothetical protein A2982_03950 [candidate division WWE3 bacterium RIFCSPLOWO2_01_FULL_39_13]
MVDDIKYKETQLIKRLIAEIESMKDVFKQFKEFSHIEENIRSESVLKSAVFSARIEGNSLTPDKLRFEGVQRKNEDTARLECFNLMRAYKLITSGRYPKKVTLCYINKLHFVAIDKLSPSPGKFRQEPWAIFSQSGAVVYLAPPHTDVPRLMQDLIKYINKSPFHCVVKSAFAQYVLEKIHPYADGNGRVGRLVSSLILHQGGYSFRGLISFEEDVDANRSSYYEALEPDRDVTIFTEFFLESLVSQIKRLFPKLQAVQSESREDLLMPRRREILEIIIEHPYCSFDFLSRRFQRVNPKTLHHDIKYLQKKNFIEKVGKTRGSLYKSASNRL